AATDGQSGRLNVASRTAEDASEIWAVVAAVEGLTIREVAKAAEGLRLRAFESLRSINGALQDHAGESVADPNRHFDLDSEFHRTIVASGAGPRLRALHESIKPQTERYFRLYTSSIVDRIDVSVAEHEQIVLAIESGDPDAAVRAVEANWYNGVDPL